MAAVSMDRKLLSMLTIAYIPNSLEATKILVCNAASIL